MNNPPAFPQHPVFDATERVEFGGMTLRDYFAAAAMQLLEVKNNATVEKFAKDGAEICYVIADAMLKAREQ